MTGASRAILHLVRTGRPGHLLVVAGLTVVMAVSATQPAVLIGRAVDRAARDRAWFGPLVVAAVMLLLRPVLELLRRRVVHRCSGEAGAALREAALGTVLRAHAPPADPGLVSVRIGRGAEGAERLTRLVASDVAGVVTQVVTVLVTAFAVAGTTTAAAMAALALAVLATTLVQLRCEGGVRHGLERATAQLDADQHELLGGGDVLRSTGAVGNEVGRIAHAARVLVFDAVHHHVRMARWDMAKSTIEGAGIVAVAAIGAVALADGRTTGGAVLATIALLKDLVGPLREVHRVLDEGQQALVQTSDMLAFLDLPPLPRYDTAPLDCPVDGAVGLRGVRVGNRLAADLVVADGERVLLTGPSGGGKSTTLRAVAGLLTPDDGAVLVGGTPVERFDEQALVGAVGYLPQAPFVRNGTVRENLLLGDAGLDDDDVLGRALDNVGLLEVVLRRGGLDVAVVVRRADGTWNWSGGEIQRLALARVLVRRPRVLLLDEPTANLDERSALAIWTLLERWEGTVLVATHDLDRAMAGRIVRVAGGTIDSNISV